MIVTNRESRNGNGMGKFFNGRDLELGHYGRLDNRSSDTRLVVFYAKSDG